MTSVAAVELAPIVPLLVEPAVLVAALAVPTPTLAVVAVLIDVHVEVHGEVHFDIDFDGEVGVDAAGFDSEAGVGDKLHADDSIDGIDGC